MNQHINKIMPFFQQSGKTAKLHKKFHFPKIKRRFPGIKKTHSHNK